MSNYTIISYCCGTWPNTGGVARYDTQLKIIFPKRIFFTGPQEKNQMLEFLKLCKNPIIITDNHLSCDIPNEYPVLLVHHGCAVITAQRTPDWDPYWKNLCCDGQNKMLNYRNPSNTWIISISESCISDFMSNYGNNYTKFNNKKILHSSEFEELFVKKSFNNIPIVLGNWDHVKKGGNIVNNLKNNNFFEFKQLNIYPNHNENLESFNKRKQEIYLNSDIFLQLSVSEGNSYATLDALLCGLVVVASNVGLFYKDVPEDCFVKIEWEKNNDLDYVLEKLNYAWENKEILSKNARKWYLENCNFIDWENKMKNIVNDFYNYNYENYLTKLGTEYGGWILPNYLGLDENSIIYSAGVGEDMSFDLLLWNKLKSKIVLIDPTIRAIQYFQEIQHYFNDNQNYKEKFKNTYLNDLNFKPNFEDFCYIDKALWNKNEKLKFFKQSNPLYVSQSLIENMYTNDYYEVETITLIEIMKKFSHTKIDLLKMDIEGAEINVLENMLNNNIFPKFLLIEFDLKLKNKDFYNTTDKIINTLLELGYLILKNDNFNITFFFNK
jgi:FkbM family methyltransferase